MDSNNKNHNTDVLDRITDRLEEELTDVCTYNALYETFMSQHMFEEASFIELIARDEFKHANILQNILNTHRVDTSKHPEIPALWDKAKRAFHL